MKNKTLRAFVALDIPLQMQSQLEAIQNLARTYIPKANWVAPQNMHITLHFLGEISAERISHLAESMESINTVSAIDLRLLSLGFFARRAFWAGVAESTELTVIYSSVASLLRSQAFITENRKFMPHVTLARMKNYTGETNPVMEIPVNLSCTIQSLTLYQSNQTVHGSIYSPLKRIPLI